MASQADALRTKKTAGRVDLSEFKEGWLKLLPPHGAGHYFKAHMSRHGLRMTSACGMVRPFDQLRQDSAAPVAFWIGSFPRCARCEAARLR